ncbi:DUF397 domain-containing protein [Actinomadura madurae]|uniref:DUF397 domain-containing protein n=1 Tax=Actinomadura madurae TaxID=1993 RepID=UPI0039998788
MKGYSSLTAPEWRKSTHSDSADCVEVAGGSRVVETSILIRDSKDPRGGILCLSLQDWRSLIMHVKTGGFDVSTH